MNNAIKKLDLEIKITNNLNDIKEYTESACNYLIRPNDEIDLDEIIMYLSSVPEICNEINELICNLEEIYEKEVNDYEQL